MANVVYPASVKTETEKLNAVYSLVEQMRLEHNDRLDDAKSKGVYPEYWKLFKSKLRPLLAEKDRLKEDIRKASYTDKQWKEFSNYDRELAYRALYGDIATIKESPTKATSELIDQLKAVDLSELSKSIIPDPYEDFTGFTEVDPQSELSETSTKITGTQFHYAYEAYVYKDYGAGHFTNYNHFLELYYDETSGNSYGEGTHIWVLANLVDDYYGIYAASGDLHAVRMRDWGSDWTLALIEMVNASQEVDYCAYNLNRDTLYFLELERIDTSLACYVRTGSHSGTLIDTMSLTVGSESFRYLYGTMGQTNISTSYWQTFYVQNLDIQEGGGNEYEISCTDGVALGDSPSENLIINLSLSDGISSGDSLGSNMIMNISISDGISSGDSPGSGLNLDISLADGITLADVLTASLTIGIALSDGIKAGDIDAAQLLANISISDGISLGDQLAAGIVFDIASADGIKLSDSAQAVIAQLIATSDGILLGDSPISNIEININAADGIALSEVISTICQFYLTIADGAKIGDAPVITLETTQAGIDITMKLPARSATSKLNSRSVTMKLNSRSTTTESPYGRS